MSSLRSARRAAAWLIALAPLLFLIEPVRQWIESRMAWHMLLQFPLLLASGTSIATSASEHTEWLRSYDRVDAHGLLGATLVSCVLAYWMVPAALDMALLGEPARFAKYASLWLAGIALGRSHVRISDGLRLFFVGSLVWMMATVGLIYQTLPQRLCVNYLIDEQRLTGAGLVAAAALLTLATAILMVMRPPPRPSTEVRSVSTTKATL